MFPSGLLTTSGMSCELIRENQDGSVWQCAIVKAIFVSPTNSASTGGGIGARTLVYSMAAAIQCPAAEIENGSDDI